ncbi:MAG: cyclodeaminase/cyclohydrolase family protein, partial [Candidatus Eremiobacteraeota bacterium]|nr:cyclodeaminase/cyclohydrolase family protein [Candidatus Eremiobacteraeota bacterium]
MEDYLERLASREPTPGGGSAAAVVGTLGAALIGMVARLTLSNEKRVSAHDAARAVLERADALRLTLTRARAADEAAYRAVIDALALPRSTDEERQARTEVLQRALAAASAAPLAVARSAAAVLDAATDALGFANRNIASDVGCAAEFARAA